MFKDKMNPLLILSSIFLLLSSTKSEDLDYYWHDYRGGDPANIQNIYVLDIADSDGQPIYIGQVYVHNYGIFVAKIKQGIDPVQVAAYGVHEQALADNLVKVLCVGTGSLKHNLTSTSTFHQFIAENLLSPIPGGYDHVSGDSGILDIGIASYEGQIEVGSIRAFDPEEPYLSIAYEGEEVRIDDYHVLVADSSTG